MPMFSYSCKNGHKTEELFLGSEKVKAWVKCHCGARGKKDMPLISNMNKTWSEEAGTGEYFSPSAGCFVAGRNEEDKIMKEKGFIPESQLPDNFWEDETMRRREVGKQHNELAKTYKEKVDSGTSKEVAIQETFTAEKCLDGSLEKLYATES